MVKYSAIESNIENGGSVLMEYNHMKEIYFSPTGTTKTIVNEITKYFSRKKEEYDLLNNPPEEEISFGNEDFVVVECLYMQVGYQPYVLKVFQR